MANRCLVPLEYLVNSNSYLNFEFKGKIKFITVTQYRFQNFEDNGKKVYNIDHNSFLQESSTFRVVELAMRRTLMEETLPRKYGKSP